MMAAAGATSSPSVTPPAPEVQRELIAEAMKLEMKQGQVMCVCAPAVLAALLFAETLLREPERMSRLSAITRSPVPSHCAHRAQ